MARSDVKKTAERANELHRTARAAANMGLDEMDVLAASVHSTFNGLTRANNLAIRRVQHPSGGGARAADGASGRPRRRSRHLSCASTRASVASVASMRCRYVHAVPCCGRTAAEFATCVLMGSHFHCSCASCRVARLPFFYRERGNFALVACLLFSHYILSLRVH
jgi:hypothetical protein